MSRILLNSSCWIEYFKSLKSLNVLDELIESNQICINDLILFSLDKHFRLMKEIFDFKIFDYNKERT